LTKILAHKITPYIPWLTVYAVAAGTLYLWGYWSKFHVNILEYIGLLELATAAAFPLLSASVGVVVGIILGQFFRMENMPAGGGKESTFGRFLNRQAKLLLFIYLAIVLVGFSLVGTADARAFVVPLALSPLIIFSISQRDFLSDVIGDPNTRTIVISILTLILCSAFGQGRNRAADIVSGRSYFAIESESLVHLSSKYVGQAGEFKYLGHAGDYVFALEPNSSLLIIRAETIPSLVLLYRTTTRPWPPWSND